MSIVEFLLLLALCLTVGAVVELDKHIKIAKCRIMCLVLFGDNGYCKLGYTNSPFENTTCRECWRKCYTVEHSETPGSTACRYRGDNGATSIMNQIVCYQWMHLWEEQKIFADNLPEPLKQLPPIERFQIAIVFDYDDDHQSYYLKCYYPECPESSLRAPWIVVVGLNNIYHYAKHHWTPKLEFLRDGRLIQAAISWKNSNSEQEKTIGFTSHDNLKSRIVSSNDLATHMVGVFRYKSVQPSAKEYVLSWHTEGSSSLGNMPTNFSAAQISLVRGSKYYVRLADKEGPGSDYLAVDIRNEMLEKYRRIYFEDSSSSESAFLYDVYAPLRCTNRLDIYAIVAGCVAALAAVVTVVLLVRVYRKRTLKKDVTDLQEVR